MNQIPGEQTKIQLKEAWMQLCKKYLPVVPQGSLWRFSRAAGELDLEQGWKLHLAATILSAVDVLRIIGPTLLQRSLLFKAPLSLYELDRLNAGIFYGYSQVGKCFTIYPKSTEEAIWLARKLDRLTRHLQAPVVPFENKIGNGSCVYYRYGAFKTLQIESSDGESQYAMRDPKGNLVADVRDNLTTPEWVNDPFASQIRRKPISHEVTPLRTTFKIFRALSQRGKGGVYLALDLSVSPPRLCTVKEGRKHGEVEWDGRDGSWRVKHESDALKELGALGVNVPLVYATFEADQNFYMATEYIDGENVELWLTKKSRKLSIKAAVRFCLQIAKLISNIHSSGFVWRDCKPRNLIRTRNGKVRPIDFEGAYSVNQPDPLPYGTASYLAPEWRNEFHGQSRTPEDLYAMGVVFYLVFAGRAPDAKGALSLEKMREGAPKGVLRIVKDLLSDIPQERPKAELVVKRLEAMLLRL